MSELGSDVTVGWCSLGCSLKETPSQTTNGPRNRLNLLKTQGMPVMGLSAIFTLQENQVYFIDVAAAWQLTC